MTEYLQHNHVDLGRWGGCLACQSGMPDQVCHAVPDICSYHWEDTQIDSLLVCNRHGMTSVFAETEMSNEPCLAIKCEGEFANYVHDPKAAVISHEHERIIRELAELKRREDMLEAMSDYQEYMTYYQGGDCE